MRPKLLATSRLRDVTQPATTIKLIITKANYVFISHHAARISSNRGVYSNALRAAFTYNKKNSNVAHLNGGISNYALCSCVQSSQQRAMRSCHLQQFAYRKHPLSGQSG